MKFYPMTISVPAKGELIASTTAVADTFFRRLKGLLGVKQLPPGSALLIKPCSSIHTFGMKFAIDVIFLDTARTVSAVYPDVKPGRIVTGGPDAAVALEVPRGTVRRAAIVRGDQLNICQGS